MKLKSNALLLKKVNKSFLNFVVRNCVQSILKMFSNVVIRQFKLYLYNPQPTIGRTLNHVFTHSQKRSEKQNAEKGNS